MSVLPTVRIHVHVPAYNAKTIKHEADAEATYMVPPTDSLVIDATAMGLQAKDRPPYIEVTIEGESTPRFYCRSTPLTIQGKVINVYVVVDGFHRGSTLYVVAA